MAYDKNWFIGVALMGGIILIIFFILKGLIFPAIFDIHLAMVMVFFIWALNWSKASLGSPRIAVVYAAVLVYLTIYKHISIAIAILVILFLATFGKTFFEKIFKGPEETKPTMVLLKDVK